MSDLVTHKLSVLSCCRDETDGMAIAKEKEQLTNRLLIFKEDAFDKRSKTHYLKGNLKEYYAFLISYSQGIVFRLLDDEEILFIEIGNHDVCY
jgi:mRNA-degrading endonuclease YafQ of YafQ-DinJ toxin-antitoxin module